MNACHASAPGKLVLLGEYAVLEGAPALVAAIDRRARAHVAAGVDGMLEVAAPELGIAGARARVEVGGRLHWQHDAALAARLHLVTATWQALADSGCAPAVGAGLRITLDTAGFFDTAGRGKLGLGSSAALCVALASALAHVAGQAPLVADRGAWLRRLIALHGGWQGGQGSGLDVAASLHGGLIRFDRAAMTAQPRSWPPAGATCLFVWSGQSVSTRGFLDHLAAWRRAQPARFAARMGALCRLAEGADAALAQGAAAFVALVDAYAAALREFARASGLEIFTPAQERLAELAARAGAVCKPCGAGGDFAVVVAADAARLEGLRRSIIADGLQPTALAVDPHGLQIDGSFVQSGPPSRDAANSGRDPS